MSNRYSAIDSDDLLNRNDERRYQLHAIMALVVLTLVIYVGSAWAPALQDDADAAHAQAAREIVERNDWTTLHINGIRYLEKAPLMYWMVAASYKVFGFTEFGTRFPLALGTLALVLAVYQFGQWMGGVRAGFYAGLAVCVGLGVYLFTRIMIPEVILSFWITVSFYAFLRAYFEEVDSPWYYVFYAGMAAAVMTKGLIGIVFPCGALALFVLVTGGITRIWSMRPVTGILLFLLLASPWH
ncbi:MAG TPA: glycosyltransferase family 39 protein, partial [Acidobacteriota bacterium]|nr:glycosyltransferase family 39 protein [Acidobacteriota bacterium]